MIQELLGGSSDVFGAVGALATGLVAFKVALGICRFISAFFLSGVIGLAADVRKAGSWAVVTGCTDGIGKAYAEKLAAKGMNVVLISRTESKLREMAKEVESKYNVKTKIYAADFTRSDIYEGLESLLNDLEIGVLVNNVGCSYDHPEYFSHVETEDFVRNMINMNCLSVAKMTRIVLPKMEQRKTGYIINIGSSAGSTPVPLLSLYSGTKAFVEIFSRSLQMEYGSKGITIQGDLKFLCARPGRVPHKLSVECVKPYFVVSKLSKFRKASFFVPSPNTFVSSALNTLGVQTLTTGYWAHSIQDFYMMLLPSFVSVNFLKQARSRALAKKAAQGKSN